MSKKCRKVNQFFRNYLCTSLQTSLSKMNTSIGPSSNNDLKAVVIETSTTANGKKAKTATEATEVVTAAVEPSPKTENLTKKLSLTTGNSVMNFDEKQALILERPKRISFCKDPVITDINSTSVSNQTTQPTVRPFFIHMY